MFSAEHFYSADAGQLPLDVIEKPPEKVEKWLAREEPQVVGRKNSQKQAIWNVHWQAHSGQGPRSIVYVLLIYMLPGAEGDLKTESNNSQWEPYIPLCEYFGNLWGNFVVVVIAIMVEYSWLYWARLLDNFQCIRRPRLLKIYSVLCGGI